MRLRILCLTLTLGLPLTAAAAPQDFDVEAVRATKRVAAVRIAEPIVIDGVLDEAAWALAEPAVDFHQQFPDEFGPATERSEVRFLYDDDMLYIGAMMYDGEPDRLIIDSLRRDFSNFPDRLVPASCSTRSSINATGTGSSPTPAAHSVTCRRPTTAGATTATGTAPGSSARPCSRTAGAPRWRCPSRRSDFHRATCSSGDSTCSASSAARTSS